MYLCSLDFCYRRYFSDTGCIFIYLPAPIEDTFFHAHVSPISLSLSLQILLNHLTMYNCIFITRKITIADTRHQQMASSLPGKASLQILTINKWHLHCLENHHRRCSPSANSIFIAWKITIADARHQQMASSLPEESSLQILLNNKSDAGALLPHYSCQSYVHNFSFHPFKL